MIKELLHIRVVFYLLIVPATQAQEWMPAMNLQQVVREELGIPQAQMLTTADMKRLNGFDGRKRGITDLTGLEHATYLPRVTGGTVKNGAYVDAEVINSAAKIEVTFSEQVRGHIALQTFGGDDVGWLGEVEGNKGVLELVRGKEIGNGTLYVIVCVVTDTAGNRPEIKTLFHTKGVKRSVVEELVIPEEPKVSFKNDILPIFKAHCQECHRRSVRFDPKSGLDLSSYKSTMNGRVFDPGWSKQSTMYWRIRSDQHRIHRMPLGKPPLSDVQIQLILDWIDAGAKNN